MCWHVYIYFSQYSQNLTSYLNSNNPDPNYQKVVNPLHIVGLNGKYMQNCSKLIL